MDLNCQRWIRHTLSILACTIAVALAHNVYEIAGYGFYCGRAQHINTSTAGVTPAICKAWCDNNSMCRAYVTYEGANCDNTCLAYTRNDCSLKYREASSCGGTITAYNKIEVDWPVMAKKEEGEVRPETVIMPLMDMDNLTMIDYGFAGVAAFGMLLFLVWNALITSVRPSCCSRRGQLDGLPPLLDCAYTDQTLREDMVNALSEFLLQPPREKDNFLQPVEKRKLPAAPMCTLQVEYSSNRSSLYWRMFETTLLDAHRFLFGLCVQSLLVAFSTRVVPGLHNAFDSLGRAHTVLLPLSSFVIAFYVANAVNKFHGVVNAVAKVQDSAQGLAMVLGSLLVPLKEIPWIQQELWTTYRYLNVTHLMVYREISPRIRMAVERSDLVAKGLLERIEKEALDKAESAMSTMLMWVSGLVNRLLTSRVVSQHYAQVLFDSVTELVQASSLLTGEARYGAPHSVAQAMRVLGRAVSMLTPFGLAQLFRDVNTGSEAYILCLLGTLLVGTFFAGATSLAEALANPFGDTLDSLNPDFVLLSSERHIFNCLACEVKRLQILEGYADRHAQHMAARQRQMAIDAYRANPTAAASQNWSPYGVPGYGVPGPMPMGGMQPMGGFGHSSYSSGESIYSESIYSDYSTGSFGQSYGYPAPRGQGYGYPDGAFRHGGYAYQGDGAESYGESYMEGMSQMGASEGASILDDGSQYGDWAGVPNEPYDAQHEEDIASERSAGLRPMALQMPGQAGPGKGTMAIDPNTPAYSTGLLEACWDALTEPREITLDEASLQRLEELVTSPLNDLASAFVSDPSLAPHLNAMSNGVASSIAGGDDAAASEKVILDLVQQLQNEVNKVSDLRTQVNMIRSRPPPGGQVRRGNSGGNVRRLEHVPEGEEPEAPPQLPAGPTGPGATAPTAGMECRALVPTGVTIGPFEARMIHESERLVHVYISEAPGNQAISWARVAEALCDLGQRGNDFRRMMVDVFRTVPFEAYFWECPPLSRQRAPNTRFEFVLLNAPMLEQQPQDPKALPFREFLEPKQGSRVAEVFDSPDGSGNRILAPAMATGDSRMYLHPGRFFREGPPEQADALLRSLGLELDTCTQKMGGDTPFWVMMESTGVPWVHVRIDRSPKKGHHKPYKAWAAPAGVIE